MDRMRLSKMVVIKPSNEPAYISLPAEGENHFSIKFKNKEVIIRMYDADMMGEFYNGIEEEWVQFVLENSNSLLIDEGEMWDEFVMFLN
jgi:arabinogalactan endo-1,4-beta-galactosidase